MSAGGKVERSVHYSIFLVRRAKEKAKGVPLLEWEMAPASVGAKADLSALASGGESWTG